MTHEAPRPRVLLQPDSLSETELGSTCGTLLSAPRGCLLDQAGEVGQGQGDDAQGGARVRARDRNGGSARVRAALALTETLRAHRRTGG